MVYGRQDVDTRQHEHGSLATAGFAWRGVRT